MRIATFNINTINRRLEGLLIWLAATEPDIVCLQELKCAQRDFPAAALRKAGYHAVWRGQPAWNGVAILSRGKAPVVIRDALPGDPADDQSRYIEAAVDGVVIGCLYAPNGNPQPGPKFDCKLAWHDRLNTHAAGLLQKGVPVILAGDYNIVPEPRDIYPTTSYDDNALVQPQSREKFATLLEQGWTDAIRERLPDKAVYTFWDYRRQRWERDAGLRIDHILLSPELAGRLAAAGVDRVMRGAENASDHAPVWARLG